MNKLVTIGLAALPGGLALGLGGVFAKLYASAAVGIPTMDRPGIRGRVVRSCMTVFPTLVFKPAQMQYVVDAVMAIVHNESNGDPANYLGDDGLPAAGGGSIGPMQVSFATARAMGLVSQDETLDQYKMRAPNEAWGIKAGVRVFRDKWESTGDLPGAIKHYNGSGPAADKYQAKALAFEADKFGITQGNS